MRAHSHNRFSAGFTIIELLVAVGVTALLVSLMLTIVVNVMGGWNRSSGTLTSGNQARLVLDQISRDLQSAILKRDGNVWLAATIQQSQPTDGGDAGMTGDASWPANAKPSGNAANETASTGSYYVPSGTDPRLEDYRFGQAGMWLRFISSVADTNASLDRLSAPRAVSYQIVRLPVVEGSSEVRYQLFRSEVGPRETFEEGYNLFSSVYNSTAAPASLTAAGIVRRPELLANPERQYIIANNVVDFGVRVWARNASTNNLEIAFPVSGSAKKGFAATSNTTLVPTPAPASGALAAADIEYGFPEVIDVFVRVLTDEGISQIALLEDAPSGYVAPGTWWEIALANSRVYTRRIEIKAKSF